MTEYNPIKLAAAISDRIAQQISDDIKRNIEPDLSRINNLLNIAALQRLATNEHAHIRRKDTFRKEVLERLNRIAKKLPKSHPVRRTIEIEYLKG